VFKFDVVSNGDKIVKWVKNESVSKRLNSVVIICYRLKIEKNSYIWLTLNRLKPL